MTFGPSRDAFVGSMMMVADVLQEGATAMTKAHVRFPALSSRRPRGARRSTPARPLMLPGATATEEEEEEEEEEPLPARCAIRSLVACAWRTLVLLVERRISQPARNVGRRVRFVDGTRSEVYRETIIDRPPPAEPAVLVVCFRLRWVRRGWAHALFRLESELNTVLFAGFPGLVSKLWLRHDQHGVYRGFYQWDGADQAVAYVRALRRVLALVSEPGSIHHAVLPGLDRDELLSDPTRVDSTASPPGGWWRPAREPGRAA